MKVLIIALITLWHTTLGDGFIETEPMPSVVVEFGHIYILKEDVR